MKRFNAPTQAIYSVALCAAMGFATLPVAAQERPELRQVVRSCSGSVAYQAAANQTIEVVFPDGSSVVIAPGSEARVACDAQGVITVDLEQGLVRVSGGLTNRAQPVLISSGGTNYALSNGSAVVASDGSGSRGHLLNGETLTITSGGQERVVYRPGFEVVSEGGGLTRPIRMSVEDVVTDLRALNPGLANGVAPAVSGSAGGGGAPSGEVTSAFAGLSEENEAVEVRVSEVDDQDVSLADEEDAEPTDPDPSEPEPTDPDPVDPDPVDPDPVDPVDPDPVDPVDPDPVDPVTPDPVDPVTPDPVDPVTPDPVDPVTPDPVTPDPVTPDPVTPDPVTPPSPPSPPAGFDAGVGNIDLAGSFDPSLGGGPDAVTENNTTVTDGNYVNRLQEAVNDNPSEGASVDYPTLTLRNFGPTAISVYGSDGLTETIEDPSDILTYGNGSGGASYFAGSSVVGVKAATAQPLFDEIGWFLFTKQRTLDSHAGAVQAEVLDDDVFFSTTIRTSSGQFVASSSFRGPEVLMARPELIGSLEMRGAIVNGMNFGNAICEGASFSACSSPRLADNFVFLDFVPAISIAVTGCPSSDCEPVVTSLIAEAQAATGSTEFYRSDSGNLGAALVPDPTDETRVIFAAGDLDGLQTDDTPGHTLDTYYLSAGLAGDILSGIGALTPGMDQSSGAARAFLRDETWLDLDARPGGFALAASEIVNSPLYVINPTGALLTPGNTSKVLHADFALRGAGSAQVSTISATIGEFTFSAPSGTEADGFLDARTVGSSRGLTASGETAGSIHLSTDMVSTAAGGGNTNIPGTGRLGFFVLENTGETFVNGASAGVLPGGIETPLGVDAGALDREFAFGRLAVGTGTGAVAARNGFGMDAVGYAAAFVESETGGSEISLARISAPEDGPNLTFGAFDDDNNTFEATLTIGGADLSFGGTGGNSAYVSDALYGALSTTAGTDMALVAGDLVADGLTGTFTQTDSSPTPTPGGYQHVKWGFFMGDVSTGPDGSRLHTHMGSFAAGDRLTATEGLSVTNPVVTYSGHAVGNVSNAGDAYTAVGTYSDTFDFGTRSGTVTMDFDGRTWTGPSTSTQNLQTYDATLSGGSGLTGTASGQFIAPLVDNGPGLSPAGIVGAFGLQNNTTNPSITYRATGTFGVEQ